jgi:hypothetical protein
MSPGASSFGPRWEGFTDNVMGGLTQMKSGWGTESDVRFLRIEGRVRTENNGGFLQMRLPVSSDGGSFDARSWKGVKVIARGLPGKYAVHIRTAQNWFPWQYFTSTLTISENWNELILPFSRFRNESGTLSTPDLRTIKSIALVAIGEAFDARLDVRYLAFVP